MAKKNIFDMILNTINEVQTKNKTNPNVETADPTVFDLIKNKLQNLDEKNRAKRTQRGKSPVRKKKLKEQEEKTKEIKMCQRQINLFLILS